jgi:Protein of unknown function (DUF3551)
MRKPMTAGLALSALCAASGKVHGEVNYPWCVIGDSRGFECIFSSREQCMQDGRNRGFGGQCMKNPAYKPGVPTVSPTARPTQAVSAAHSTCTGLKSACLSGKDCYSTGVVSAPRYGGVAGWYYFFRGRAAPNCENLCNFTWEHCMKSGLWEGGFMSRPAERR